MQHDTTTCNMIQQHTTRWSNGTNFFFTTNVACCCMKSWDRLTGALLQYFVSNFFCGMSESTQYHSVTFFNENQLFHQFLRLWEMASDTCSTFIRKRQSLGFCGLLLEPVLGHVLINRARKERALHQVIKYSHGTI